MSKVYQAEGGNMFWLGCCSKCNGDLYEDRDHYGTYIACIQCGHYLNGAETARIKLASDPRFGNGARTGQEIDRDLVGAGRAA